MRLPLHARTLLGAALGAAAGAAGHGLLGPESAWLDGIVRYGTGPAGQIFLRLLFMLVVPLILAALSLGVAGLVDLRRLGRLGLRTLLYTVTLSAVAVLLGLLAANALGPGRGVSAEQRAALLAEAARNPAPIAATQAPAAGIEFLVRIVPDNPLRAAAEGDYLAWMFFSLLVGVGLCLVRTDGARRLEEMLQGLFDVSMKLIGFVIALAPLGVFALLFTLTARLGYGVLRQLLAYVAVVLAALAVHQFGVYALAVRFLGGMSPRFFFRGATPAMVTAFATASSNATLPTTLQAAEHNLRLPPEVSRFVLTVGATANQNGTALFATVAALFLAQFYGVPLDLRQQCLVAGVCVLCGIGTAGIPSGSLPVVAMLLGMVGIPAEGIGLIYGVDRLLDMCRTTLNVTGDLSAAVVVARLEADRGPPRA